MQSLDLHRSALDGSSTGCGKTVVAAKIAATYRRPTLVVCPKSVIPMWKRELYGQGVQPLGVINYEMLRTGRSAYGEWKRPLPKQMIWDTGLPTDSLIIWDEVQRCQGMNTQNAKMLWSSKKHFNLCLSATAAKDPTEMKALGFVLGLHKLRDFWKWAKQRGCYNGTFGGLEFSGKTEHLYALHKEIFPEHGSRMTVSDLSEHFTETQIITTPIEFGDELRNIYKQMEEELNKLSDREKNDPTEVLTIRLRARQRAELCKVPIILEMVEDFLAEGRSLAIFVNFTDTLEAIRERLSVLTTVGMISGGYVKDRQKYIDDFAADRIRVMICNTQAGGVSVNLHDQRGEFPRTSIISPSDNEKDILQCLGRIHRAGGETPTQQHVLFAADTIESEVEYNCRKKIEQIGIINCGQNE